tara:strand:- start:28 stop:1086 length:1059 start_codon:yes stop_codon:yes gene_type:complete
MRLGIPGAIMNARNFSRKSDFERDFFPDDLGIDLSRLPTVSPVSIEKMPAPTPTPTPTPATGGTPGTNWWQAAGYPDAATAIMSGNFRYDMNTGWVPKEETSTNMGAMTSPTLGPLGTSGMSVFEGEPMTMTSESTMSPMIDPEVTPMDSDIDRAIAAALSGAENPVLNVDEAVEAAVGNGQPTTDDTILDEDDMQFGTQVMSYYYNPATGETYDSTGSLDTPPEGFIPMDENYTPGMGTETPAQPDFMTQLQELIAQMQAEQTAAAEAQAAAQKAAAEQAAAAEQQRQEQVAAMTQNYMVGQPAVGYNPYESGQYQSDPYGAAGVPDMGGITSIPVPAAYNPNPYPMGGMT